MIRKLINSGVEFKVKGQSNDPHETGYPEVWLF